MGFQARQGRERLRELKVIERGVAVSSSWGQNDLARIADESGGEAYFQGFQTPIAFAPYLEDLTSKLNHQYLLTFVPKPEEKAGFRSVKLQTEVSNAELAAADRVYVPATQQKE